jgi:hypothetical protein
MIIIPVILIIVWYTIKVYNSIKPLENMIAEADSNIVIVTRKRDTMLKSLNEVVSSYSHYEKGILEKISEDMKPGDSVEFYISRLSNLYPDLKLNDTQKVMVDALYSVESERQGIIEIYNNRVKRYNDYATSFPEILICRSLSFREKLYYL